MKLIYFAENGLPVKGEFKAAKELTALCTLGLLKECVSAKQYDRVVRAYYSKAFSPHQTTYWNMARHVLAGARDERRAACARGEKSAAYFSLNDDEIANFKVAVANAGLKLNKKDFLIIEDQSRHKGAKRKVYQIKENLLSKSEMTALAVTVAMGTLEKKAANRVVAIWENETLHFSDIVRELEKVTDHPVTPEAVIKGMRLVDQYRGQLRAQPAAGD